MRTPQFSYWIFYESQDDQRPRDAGPFGPADELESRAGATTWPHMLSKDLVSILPVLWYALHLPRSIFDFMALPLDALALSSTLDVPANIVVLEQSALDDDLTPLRGYYPPTLVFAPPSARARAQVSCAAAAAILPLEDARTFQLEAHWRLLSHGFALAAHELRRPPALCTSSSVAGAVLPLRFMLRQLHRDGSVVDAAAEDQPLRAGWAVHAHVAILANLEAAGVVERQSSYR